LKTQRIDPIFEKIELKRVDPNPLALRLEDLEISDLALSLSRHGQLLPIKVRPHPAEPGRFQIVYGHRRLAAAKTLGWDSLLAELVDATDEQMVVFALTENLERNNYSDYEQALLIRKLNEEFGKSFDEIAAIMGRSKAYVSQHIAMTKIFDSPQIDKKEATEVLLRLTERQARILSRIPNPVERLQTAKLAIAENLCVKEVERLVGHPREVIHFDDDSRDETNRREKKRKAEEEITEVIRKTLDGLSRRDMTPFLSARNPKVFSLFDDFPPFDLLDYEKAAEHNSAIIRHLDDIRLSYDDLKIYIFGRFAYATFLVTYKIVYLGKWLVVRSRVTFIFIEDNNNNWLITHEHWSPLEYDFLTEIKKLESEIFKNDVQSTIIREKIA
jgi:ParB/RepB/Spo0J family partition protein